MTESIRLTLGDRIAQRAPTIRPWQRSLASLVSEAFDDIEALPRTADGYFSELAASIDEHLEQEFRHDMAQCRITAATRLDRNPHDESAKALLAWVEELEASPPLTPVNIGTLRETVFRERVKRKKAGTYERVAHGVRKLFTSGHAVPPAPPVSREVALTLASASQDKMQTAAIVAAAEASPRDSGHDTTDAHSGPPGNSAEARNPGPEGHIEPPRAKAPTVDAQEDSDDRIELGASDAGALAQPAHQANESSNHSSGDHARVTNPSTPDEGVDAMYSQLNSGRGYDVERVGEMRAVRPRKLK